MPNPSPSHLMSVTDIERGLVARYMHRLLSRTDIPSRAVRALLVWLNERADVLSLPMPQPLIDALGGYMAFKPADFEAAWACHRPSVIGMLDGAASQTPRPEPLATNAKMLTEALGLPRAAWMLLGVIACSSRFDQVGYLVGSAVDNVGPATRALSLLIGEPQATVDALLMPSGELVASGLIQVREDSLYMTGSDARYAIPGRVNVCLDRPFASFAQMRSAVLGEPLIASVGYADYEHVAADRDLIAGVLRGALDAGEAGVNILLYGPPGSGKTELAKVVAAAAGGSLLATGEESSSGRGEADRSGRLADLVFSQRLLAGQDRTVLLFDEMEDVAVHLIKRGGSKVYLNRLLETNPVPIVWTSNELANIDPALLRRMTLAVELKRPPVVQRQRILERLAARAGLVLSPAEVEALARRLDATPAIYENALKAARLSGGGADAVERAALGIVRAVSGVVARKPGAIPEFDPLLATASQDLGALADRLVGAAARAFSVCLSGPPGTGKSAFARYLARRLGMELVLKRASDILGPYVGETERAIAGAFQEAEAAGAMLVFDEADSLLLDRRDAVRSWEITQVNEMLTWMEEHPLPVVFTTNYMERVDTASLRRFTFHVTLGYLDKSGLRRAWQVFLGQDRPSADWLVFANLTPGDFAKARKQAEVLGLMEQPARIAEILGEISRGKPDARGALGFTG
ncbi:MAG: AAA family ATPase [Hyphomicrobiaceae bacterium]|nr:AAA family ATPase [Hyphomicrobiaceae bacterium]